MGTATFCVLAGGKVGLFLPRQTNRVMAFAVVDISVTANDDLSSQQAGRPSTSSPKLRNAAWKRGAFVG